MIRFGSKLLLVVLIDVAQIHRKDDVRFYAFEWLSWQTSTQMGGSRGPRRPTHSKVVIRDFSPTQIFFFDAPQPVAAAMAATASVRNEITRFGH